MYRRLLTITLALLWLSAQPVWAVDWIVYDPSNFGKNEVTAAQMMLQVANSDKEVKSLAANLISVLASRYNYPLMANLIREVMYTTQGGIPMFYGLPNINAYQGDVYRGYTTATKWRGWEANYGNLAQTALNAQRGMLNTVHEELSPEDDVRINWAMNDMRRKAEVASGNKDLAQLHAYALDLQLYEARRQRRMLGALTDAVVLKNEHELNMAAWTQKTQDEFLSNGAVMPRAYTGAGGVTVINLE